ncbi:hypothetical protein D3C79_1094340 [compost metagenome]
MPQPIPIAVIRLLMADNLPKPSVVDACHWISTWVKASTVITTMINRITGMV